MRLKLPDGITSPCTFTNIYEKKTVLITNKTPCSEKTDLDKKLLINFSLNLFNHKIKKKRRSLFFICSLLV